jgi:glycosyltransferase involved in cell wall biosynthesis
MKLNIITRCTRLQHLLTIKDSVFQYPEADVTWHILFDTSVLKDIEFDLLQKLQNNKTIFYFIEGKEDDLLYPQSMSVVKTIKEGYVYYLDDDNILHPDFIPVISQIAKESKIYVVDQFVDKKDFTGLEYRIASPENTRYQGIDMAQMLIHFSVFTRYEFIGDYAADGHFAEKIYKENPSWFEYINQTLSYYNYLVKPPKAKVPKVLYIGPGQPDLKTNQLNDYEATELDVKYEETDQNLIEILTTFNPDSIVTISDNFNNFPILASQSFEVRRKWINIQEIDDWTGHASYSCAMDSMLKNENNQIISYFTPIYNTGKKLYHTYDSLKNQTNRNWEWVMINDSTDGGKTLKIAQDIASKDPRVKVYDFNPKSKGVVGEAKWRAACMSQGFLLAELDHDDYLTPDCTQVLYDACKAFPDAGFYYTDSVEVNEKWESFTYPEGFGMGYGAYQKEIVMGHEFNSSIAPNINPKTIRHIVGVPNHVRAWRRDVYFAIGGHNRGLTIADDYELIVRTFLKTKMCHINKLCYLQYLYNNGTVMNTHELSRKDIQRRVRTIRDHYNNAIKSRFEELGKEDWAYGVNDAFPWQIPSRYGNEEEYVNYKFYPKS